MTFLTIGNKNLNMQIQTIFFPTLSGGLCWPVVLVVPLRQIWRECSCSAWSDGITLHPRLRCVNFLPSNLLDEGTSLVPQQITNLFEGHISCNLVRGKILMRCQVFSSELAACHLLHNKSCQSFNKIPLPLHPRRRRVNFFHMERFIWESLSWTTVIYFQQLQLPPTIRCFL